MAEPIDDLLPLAEPGPADRPSRRWPWLLGGAGLLLAGAIGVAWQQRDTIAANVIERQLAASGVRATYRIEQIGPSQDVLSNIVIGDPAHPDLTIARATVSLVYTFGIPRLGAITLDRARLYGRLVNGRPSFGSLDSFLFAKTDPNQPPAGLPALNVILNDARARIDSDYGAIGIKLEGRGVLSDGFAGTLAATGPSLAFSGCAISHATLYGALTTRAGAPRFVGPIRAERLGCPVQALALAGLAAQTDVTVDRSLVGAQATVSARAGPLFAGTTHAQSLAFGGDLGWHRGVVDARLQGSASGLASPMASVALARIDGTLRSSGAGDLSRLELDATLDGSGIQPGQRIDAAMLAAQRSAQGTLLAPMIAQVRDRLLIERKGSHLTARFDLRRSGARITVAVPEARLIGSSGAVLASVSRASYLQAGRQSAQITGNVVTGGPGMPQISGRFEQAGNGIKARLVVAEFRAGGGSLALPALLLATARDGSLGFAGEARLSGAIPGGRAEHLVLPIDGAMASSGEFTLFRACATARFERLTLGEIELGRRALMLCPPHGQPIVRSSATGLRIAAGTPSLDLAGKFGGAPMRLTSGAIGFAYPGTLDVRTIDLTLGGADNATRLRATHLMAQVGRNFAGNFVGNFSGLEGQIAAIALDLKNGTGQWRFGGGALAIDKAAFALTDRSTPARFERLIAHDATLGLANGVITADALLREPRTDRVVVQARIRHDVSSAAGHVNLAVERLLFDKDLQPDNLTALAKGVVANAAGRIDGTGRIDWNGTKVTSGGKFSTDSLDLAAAFGPVKGIKGALVFTDLLGLVTAPNQTITVASINPGIEVLDGTVTLALLTGQEVAISGASWPFDGGTLRLEPVRLTFGTSSERRYVLLIDGLDAAKFLERMQLSNLNATGRFDGRLPLVFRGDVGRIEGGNLVSRAVGGNVSYIGPLSYKDLSTMANFAFDSLKSLDYKAMTIGVDGDLAGEIVTKVRFTGITQGQGAKQNFVTRAVAKLPLQFNVNVTAPFYSLISKAKSIYDPAATGLFDDHGIPIAAEKRIQHQASEHQP